MQKEEKYKELRQLLIGKILETKSSDKPPKYKAEKMSNERLVHALFVNAILAEREFWKSDIRKAALKISPGKKFSTNYNSIGLINRLIKLVEKSKIK